MVGARAGWLPLFFGAPHEPGAETQETEAEGGEVEGEGEALGTVGELEMVETGRGNEDAFESVIGPRVSIGTCTFSFSFHVARLLALSPIISYFSS